MKTRIIMALLLAVLTKTWGGVASPVEPPVLKLRPDDRVMVLAPHPDDEVIGCAGVILTAREMHLPVKVVYFTNGDNNEWAFLYKAKHPVVMPGAVRAMGRLREAEALDACREMGLEDADAVFLGYPDFGTMNIWQYAWGDARAYRSMLTRVTAVPYTNALSYKAEYTGPSVLHDIEKVLDDFRPTAIFVSHPGDRNVDHRALFLFTQVALWNLRDRLPGVRVYPYMVHATQWPLPRGLNVALPLHPPPRFPELAWWIVHPLTSEQQVRKLVALRKHASQVDSTTSYLLSFVRANELFGRFPVTRLQSGMSLTDLEAESPPLVPDELEPEDIPYFTGVLKRGVQLLDDRLMMRMTLSKPLGPAGSAIIMLFGYRFDKPFEEMPKVSIHLGIVKKKVMDGARRLPNDTIEYRRHAREMDISIPMAALGHPDVILTSARTLAGVVSLDLASWHVIEIKREAAAVAPAENNPAP